MSDSGSSSSSSEDSDAPEIVSLSQTKRSILESQGALNEFKRSAARKQKERNRKRDEWLKASSKSKGGAPDDEKSASQIRMERAMNEAEQEEDDDDDEQADQESKDSSEAETLTSPTNSNYLPDHLFQSAFSQPPTTTTTTSTTTSSSKPKLSQKPKKKKRKSNAKELIVGSRTFRIASKVQGPGSMTVPSPQISNFLNKRLKGGVQKGWVRRPVNIGVMKSSGAPASGFVRS